jgi:transcriptional regulator with XRE-family HTH domain
MTVIEKIRKDNNLSNKEMMAVLGITKSYYSMVRRGLRPISKEMAKRLNSSLDVPYEVSFCPSVHELDTNNGSGKARMS